MTATTIVLTAAIPRRSRRRRARPARSARPAGQPHSGSVSWSSTSRSLHVSSCAKTPMGTDRQPAPSAVSPAAATSRMPCSACFFTARGGIASTSPVSRLRQADIKPQQQACAPPGRQPGDSRQQSPVPGDTRVPAGEGACGNTGRQRSPAAQRRASLSDNPTPQVAGSRLLVTQCPPAVDNPRERLLHGLLSQADVAGHANREPDQFLAIQVIEHGNALVPSAGAARICAHNGQDYQQRPEPATARPAIPAHP